MKKSLLAVVIATSFAAPFHATAAENIAEQLAQGSNLQFADLIGGTIGTSFEYEDRVTTNPDGSKKKEKIKVNEVGQVFMRHSDTNISGFYSLKTESREQRQAGYYENEDGWRHLLNINKGFNLNYGFNAALIYEAELYDSEVVSPYSDHVSKRELNQYVKPTLYYWNPNLSMGFDTYVEFLFSEAENGWGNEYGEQGYSFVFKPYYRTGNWEFGVEFFHQIKDTDERNIDSRQSIDREFTESYAEPLISYSFEDAGVLYTRVRIGKNETSVVSSSNPWINVGDEYYKDIVKATVGYEQAVGDDWLLKAEYEFNEDTETNNLADGETVVEGNKFYVHALYRF